MSPRVRRSLIKAMGRAHLAVRRLSRGRLLGVVAGMPVLLLTTTGRRSGKRRTTPLTYFRDGDDLVVIASNGGEDRPPDWSVNLEHEPRATVDLGDGGLSVTARFAVDEQRARLWASITAEHRMYAGYQRRTSRLIPVVILSPASSSSPPRPGSAAPPG